jgi:hypothetical protein
MKLFFFFLAKVRVFIPQPGVDPTKLFSSGDEYFFWVFFAIKLDHFRVNELFSHEHAQA